MLPKSTRSEPGRRTTPVRTLSAAGTMHGSPGGTHAAEIVLELPEILSALSFALDLTEGADPGHAVRSTLLGMRIGAALDLPPAILSSLYFALQLKDVGCSSN